MRYFVLSYNRPDLQITLQSMPPDLLSQIELMVVPKEYKQYKRGWYASKVKAIHTWPDYVDCVPKKRHWIAQNAKDDYILIDDDVNLYVWSRKRDKFVRALDLPKRFAYEFMEGLPSQFETYASVAAANKFMADPFVRQHGLVKDDSVGFVMSGFAKGTTKKVQMGCTFVYTDIDLPLQVFQEHKTSCIYYGLCYNHSGVKALQNTGTSTYRSDFLKLDSAIRMAVLYQGIITGAKWNNNKGGGVTLQKWFNRVKTGVTAAHVNKTQEWLRTICAEHGLRSCPDFYRYDMETPKDYIFQKYEELWEEKLIKRKRR
jgi:hypothetical protein